MQASKLTLDLNTAAVRAILADIPEEQRIKIARGVMANAVDLYLSKLTAPEVTELRELIQKQIAATVEREVQLKILTKTDGWGGTRWEVRIPTTTLDAIQQQVEIAVNKQITLGVAGAIDRAVATLDDSITRKVRGAILMQLDGVIKNALAEMTESVVASIKAAVRSA